MTLRHQFIVNVFLIIHNKFILTYLDVKEVHRKNPYMVDRNVWYHTQNIKGTLMQI